MAKGDVFHALKHAHRQKILRTLRRRPRTYSTLLAKVEPDGEGTGRFNYHLKVLKDAGLVEVDESLYRPTPNGFAALQLLAQAPEGTAAPPRRRVQLTIAGSLIGVGGIGLLLLLSMVFAPMVLDAPGTAQYPRWNIPTFVSEQGREVASPQVGVDSNGNAIAIWTQEDGAHINVWANRFVTGVGWGAPTLIEKDNSKDAGSPMLAVGPTGIAWAVWEQTYGYAGLDSGDVWASRFVPLTGWGEATMIATDAWLGDIALDASGALTIVWNEYSRGHEFAIYAARFVPDFGWMSPTTIYDPVQSLGVQLAVDSEGRAIAVWRGGGGYSGDELYASRYDQDEQWGPAILLFEAQHVPDPSISMFVADPSIAMDSDGNAIAIWNVDIHVNREGGGMDSIVYAARFVPGFGWGDAVTIGVEGDFGNPTLLAVDAAGNAIAVWSKVRPNESWVDLFVNRFDLGIGWGEPTRIAENVGTREWHGNTADFALAMEPAGNAVVLYDDINSGIFATSYLPGEGWSIPSLIGTGGAECHPCPPAVAIDPAGNVIAVWEERKSAPIGVLASRFGEATSLEELARETRDQLEQNQKALEATFARIDSMTGWLAISLSLMVVLVVVFGVLFVVYWNPRRSLRDYREIPDVSGKPPGPGG